jgi:hypothetical protein
MRFPPLLLRLRMSSPERPWPTLWLPLFLVWLLLILLVPLALVALLVAIALYPQYAGRAFALVRALFAIILGLRGLHIDVVGKHGQLLISFH